MAKFESEIATNVEKRFMEALFKTDLTISIEDRWQTSLLTRWFDIVIYKSANPLAVIEIKNSLKNS